MNSSFVIFFFLTNLRIFNAKTYYKFVYATK
jgi:hypothetical protein